MCSVHFIYIFRVLQLGYFFSSHRNEITNILIMCMYSVWFRWWPGMTFEWWKKSNFITAHATSSIWYGIWHISFARSFVCSSLVLNIIDYVCERGYFFCNVKMKYFNSTEIGAKTTHTHTQPNLKSTTKKRKTIETQSFKLHRLK